MSRPLVLLFAMACGVAVANLYYAQPLLEILAKSFGVADASTAQIVTVSQVGYAAGLVLVVPLADLLERRRLIVGMLLLSAIGLVGAALSPSLLILEIASGAIGITSVVAQILIPLAADMADDESRGRVVGTVMAGLLLGVLVARAGSGVLADVLGWRSVYWVAAGLVVTMSVLIRIGVPLSKKSAGVRYGALLRSTLELFLSEPELRKRSLYGALGFGTFSVLWTTLTYRLSGAPYHFSSLIIGGFGLVGAAGAMSANVAGRLSDGGRAKMATGVFSIGIATAFVALWFGSGNLAILVIAIVALDLGVQGLQITNQATIYTLQPGARGRITSVYMTAYFVGGAVGSSVGGELYAIGGWSASSALGVALGAGAVLLWASEFRPRLRNSQASGSK